MGMAASQARLLSITARLTDNENTGQAISYSKQRLADQTQQITNEYNEALNATKLTVLTGFNGAEANYTDISYNVMTSLEMADMTKQYIVTDTKGKILVTEKIAEAYEKSRGNYNAFLGALKIDGTHYSQADIEVNKTSQDTDAKIETMQKIHEAWDEYFESVGINFGDKEHEVVEIGAGQYGFSFRWNETVDPDGTYNIGDGYTTYVDKNGQWQPIIYEGTTSESRDMYDYAMALTEAYLRVNPSDNGIPFNVEYDINNTKSAANSDNASALKYYRNIFDKIQSCGYFTYTNDPNPKNKNYIYASEGIDKVQKNPMKDNYTFEQALRNGTLRLEYFSSTDKSFKSTTISEDNCIQEVADERAIAKAEAKYKQDLADLENKDNRLDLELQKLDTEHEALQTEYDSVKNVVDKNVESSFKIFS